MKVVLAGLGMLALAAGISCNSPGAAAVNVTEMGGMKMSPPPSLATRETSPIHSIALPHDEAFAPAGPGREAFVTACVVCHSPRYVTSQPPLSRTSWKGVVQKMIDVYGAHVTPAQAAEIVDYLTATNGAHSTGDAGE